MLNEYIVIARSEADIDSLHAELITPTVASLTSNPYVIPTRAVQVANERLGNPCMTHYWLTDEEAAKLSCDPRVLEIQLKPTIDLKRKNVVQRSVSYDKVIGNFNRNGAQDKYNINWGLRRTSLGAAEVRPGNTYTYNNTGSGVDIIIMDDGIQIDHPEFLDITGTSRVQKIDWYVATGIAGTMPPNHYNLTNSGDGEHGTHVATIAAGKTFGYAKNARIYSLRIFGDQTQVIPDEDIFDIIRIWHSRKPIDRITKTKRPTIVNMSWGYAWYYRNSKTSSLGVMTSINYRGATTNFTSPSLPLVEYGQKTAIGSSHGIRLTAIDVAQQLAENEGVIFVHSAGNYGNKIDKANGIDYNNYYKINNTFAGVFPSGTPIYYHRGGSPTSNNCITVSAARDQTVFVKREPKEVVDSYSEKGPGCQVVAPGTNITAGTSKTSSFDTLEYVWGQNNKKDRSHFVTKISGTSMAAPQVTGVLALYLSSNPGSTPAQAKAWIENSGVKNQLVSTNKTDDWTNPNALLGGPNNYLFNPFNK